MVVLDQVTLLDSSGSSLISWPLAFGRPYLPQALPALLQTLLLDDLPPDALPPREEDADTAGAPPGGGKPVAAVPLSADAAMLLVCRWPGHSSTWSESCPCAGTRLATWMHALVNEPHMTGVSCCRFPSLCNLESTA